MVSERVRALTDRYRPLMLCRPARGCRSISSETSIRSRCVSRFSASARLSASRLPRTDKEEKAHAVASYDLVLTVDGSMLF